MCKTLIAVRLKASRLGLEDDDGSEKNTPSSSTFDKLVLPIESCRRSYLFWKKLPNLAVLLEYNVN